MCYLHPTSAPPSVLYLLLEYSASAHTCTCICVHTHMHTSHQHPPQLLLSLQAPSQVSSEISLIRLSKLDASSLSHYSLTLRNICVLPQYPYFTPITVWILKKLVYLCKYMFNVYIYIYFMYISIQIYFKNRTNYSPCMFQTSSEIPNVDMRRSCFLFSSLKIGCE